MRTYDPDLGIFTSEDPSGTAGGVNLYAYGAGDPVNLTDPFGLWPSLGDIGNAVGNVASGAYDLASSHYGVAAAMLTGTACLTVAAVACASIVIGSGIINSAIIWRNTTGDERWGSLLLNGVATGIAAIPAAALAQKGVEELFANSQILKFGVNYITGLPGVVTGLLDPHANASGGLASSLDSEE
jgi:hypothetical protein